MHAQGRVRRLEAGGYAIVDAGAGRSESAPAAAKQTAAAQATQPPPPPKAG
jgi:hypothetical protein